MSDADTDRNKMLRGRIDVLRRLLMSCVAVLEHVEPESTEEAAALQQLLARCELAVANVQAGTLL